MWSQVTLAFVSTGLLAQVPPLPVSSLIDDDKTGHRLDGEIGIQLHVTDTGMKIEVRNIRIKTSELRCQRGAAGNLFLGSK